MEKEKERRLRAFSAMKALGIAAREVQPVLLNLLEMYNWNWELIEAEDYRALIDAYFELKDNQGVKDKNECVAGNDKPEKPSKRLHLGQQKDHVCSAMTTSVQGSKKASYHLAPQGKKPTHNRELQTFYHKHSLHAHGLNFRPESMSKVGDSGARLTKQAPRIGNSERDLNKKGLNRSGCLNSSNLVTTQKQHVAGNKKRCPQSISDITKGAENVQISLVDETGYEDWPKFTYIPDNIISQNAYVHISLARIADEDCCSNCSGDCLSLSIPCACARETGGEFAYTQQGLLKEEFLSASLSMKKGPCEQHFVYCQDCPIERSKNEVHPEECKGHIVRKFIKECWRKCGCSMQCQNRVVQRGITCKLQVFLTDGSKGWGLRTLQNLPKGTFVCEYVGEIVTNTELYERNMQCSGRERHTYPVTLDADWGSERVLRDEEALCLDATFYGNVARFINHRCFDANLIDIPVEVETPDRHYYHLAFFTTRKVSASEELTWDYGIDFGDHSHPIKAFNCCCGSAFCRDVKQTS